MSARIIGSVEIPVAGYIDASNDDLVVHMPESMWKNANRFFFFGGEEFMEKPSGEQFRFVTLGGARTLHPIAERITVAQIRQDMDEMFKAES